MIGSVVCRLGR